MDKVMAYKVKMSGSTIDKAHTLLDDGKHDAAEKLLTQELESHPPSAPLLLARAQVRMRSKDVEGALEDAKKAYKYGDADTKPDAQLRKAMCYFKLKQYGVAKGLVPLFAGAKDVKAAEIWKTMILARPEPSEQEPKEDSPEPTAPTVEASKPESPAPVRKDWYQSSQSVTISVFHKGTPADAKVVLKPTSASIEASDGFSYHLDLYSKINVDTSSYDITPNKIELVLAKASPATWPKLEHDPDSVHDSVPNAIPDSISTSAPSTTKETDSSQGQSLPSFSKWDKLKITDSDSENEDGGNGSDPNQFFQKLYQDASPDAQRAMMKSFIESNGTALSTNWEEVGKGPMATYPPQGTEAKDF